MDYGGWAEEDDHRMMNALPSIQHLLANGKSRRKYIGGRREEEGISRISDATSSLQTYPSRKQTWNSEARRARYSISNATSGTGGTLHYSP